MHYIPTIRKTALKDNVEGTSASIRSFRTGYTVGKEWEGRLGHQGPRAGGRKPAGSHFRIEMVPSPTWGPWDEASVRRAGWSLADPQMP